MKQVVNNTVNLLQKIENIEKEVMDLKLSVLKTLKSNSKRLVSLKGILKDVNVTDKDIISAKKSLFGKIGV